MNLTFYFLSIDMQHIHFVLTSYVVCTKLNDFARHDGDKMKNDGVKLSAGRRYFHVFCEINQFA